MSQYPPTRLPLGLTASSTRLRAFASRSTLLSKVMPVVGGAAVAVAVGGSSRFLEPDSTLRLAAAWAATASWLYLARSPRLAWPLGVANLAMVTAIFILAILGTSHAWALPTAYVLHASWALVLDRRSLPARMWSAAHATIAALLGLT